ncbi:MAG TPA: ribosomal protein S18-alanine N-acetyltransferase [Bryobacteraceae bacterium]|nr:ribosomal protein S18-alanine N-acetyltransferase [Bryobacteraceae bacterium]
MPARIRISRFRLAQLPRILAIENAAFPREAYNRQMFLELHRDCSPLFYIARYGHAIAGYMVTCTAGSHAEIVSIAVHPQFRQRGLGAALMRHTLRRLKPAGITQVDLMVRTTNAAAIAFYRRFGFRRARCVAGYYDDGADGILYRLRLH